MIVVVASSADRRARDFAEKAGKDVKLLTCEDLSTSGWKLRVPESEPPIAVIQGERIRAREIGAAIIRLPYVSESELPHIAPSDRPYVAAEMQAFLFAFLSALKCPVVNRPTPAFLAGPNWRPVQWLKAARDSKLPVSNTPKCEFTSKTLATVVGDRCFGIANPKLKQAACRLAQATGVHLLRIWFGGEENSAPILAADLWPDLGDPEIGQAVMDFVSGGARG